MNTTTTSPQVLESIGKLVEYLYEEEKHFEGGQEKDHISRDVKRVAKWLDRVAGNGDPTAGGRAQDAVRSFLGTAARGVGGHEALAARASSYSPDFQIGEAGVGHWVRGRNHPNAWIVLALAADLGISLDDFAFAGQEEESK